MNPPNDTSTTGNSTPLQPAAAASSASAAVSAGNDSSSSSSLIAAASASSSSSFVSSSRLPEKRPMSASKSTTKPKITTTPTLAAEVAVKPRPTSVASSSSSSSSSSAASSSSSVVPATTTTKSTKSPSSKQSPTITSGTTTKPTLTTSSTTVSSSFSSSSSSSAAVKRPIKPSTKTNGSRPTSATSASKRPTTAVSSSSAAASSTTTTTTTTTTKPYLKRTSLSPLFFSSSSSSNSTASQSDRDSLSLIFSFLSLHDFCTSLRVSHSWLQTAERVTSWSRINTTHLISSYYEPELTHRNRSLTDVELSIVCTIGGTVKKEKYDPNAPLKTRGGGGGGGAAGSDDANGAASSSAAVVEVKEPEPLVLSSAEPLAPSSSSAASASSSSSSSSPSLTSPPLLPKRAPPFTRFLHTRIFHRASHISLDFLPPCFPTDELEAEWREETREKLLLFLEKTVNLQSLRLRVSAHQLGIADVTSNTSFLDTLDATLSSSKFSTHLQFLELSSLHHRMFSSLTSDGQDRSATASYRFYSILAERLTNLRILSLNQFNDHSVITSLTLALERFINLEYLHISLLGERDPSFPPTQSPNYKLLTAIRSLSLAHGKLQTLSLKLDSCCRREYVEVVMGGLCAGENGKTDSSSSSSNTSLVPPLTSLRFDSYHHIPLTHLLSSLPTLTDLRLSTPKVQFIQERLPENIRKISMKGYEIDDDFIDDAIRLPLVYSSPHIESCAFIVDSKRCYFYPTLSTFDAWLRGMTGLRELTLEGIAINSGKSGISGGSSITFDGLLACKYLQKLVLKQRPQVNMTSLLRVIAQLPEFTVLDITISPAYTPATPPPGAYDSRTERERQAGGGWDEIRTLNEPSHAFTLPPNTISVISSHQSWRVLRIHMSTTYATLRQVTNARKPMWNPNLKEGGASATSSSSVTSSSSSKSSSTSTFSMTQLLSSHPKSSRAIILNRLHRFRLYHTTELLDNSSLSTTQIYALHSVTSKRDPEGEIMWRSQESLEGYNRVLPPPREVSIRR